MMEFKLDLSAFEKIADRIGAARDQLPYAISQLMNDSAFKARQVIVEQVWPSHVTQRNPQFINTALRVEKATKHNLTVELYDRLGRASLKQHAEGGVKHAKRSNLAIPQAWAGRTSHGIRKSDRPAALIAKTPKRALRITPRGIFVGEKGRLVLKYALAPQAQIKADVPFFETWRDVFINNIRTGFAGIMAKAMNSRRR